MATPSSKASMDPNFEKRIRQLQTESKLEFEKRKEAEQHHWMRPKDWVGDPFDYEGMKPPFNRDQANQDYINAVSTPSAPGVTGDLVATTTMIDSLALMQQSFSVRMTGRRCRAATHMLGRKRGMGNSKGSYINNYLEYVREILKQAKVSQ